jgi:hypothetical protein
MPHDELGRELRVGDIVLLRAEIVCIGTRSDGATCNMEIELRSKAGHLQRFWMHTLDAQRNLKWESRADLPDLDGWRQGGVAVNSPRRGDLPHESKAAPLAAPAARECEHRFEANPGLWDTRHRYCALCGMVEP